MTTKRRRRHRLEEIVRKLHNADEIQSDGKDGVQAIDSLSMPRFCRTARRCLPWFCTCIDCDPISTRTTMTENTAKSASLSPLNQTSRQCPAKLQSQTAQSSRRRE